MRPACGGGTTLPPLALPLELGVTGRTGFAAADITRGDSPRPGAPVRPTSTAPAVRGEAVGDGTAGGRYGL